MGLGLVEDAVTWHRRGLAEPWLPDSFLAELSPEGIGRLERHANLLTDLDQVDWADPRAPVAVVLTGVVRICHIRSDGQRALLHIAGMGDLLNGESLCAQPASALRFHGTRSTRLLTLPQHRFGALLDDEDIRLAMLRTLAQRVQESAIHRSHSGRKVEHRLWAFLVALGRRHGSPTGTGVRVDLELTQGDLAAAVGALRNSVETALQRLRLAGKLTTSYTSCVLHELPDEEELDRSF